MLIYQAMAENQWEQAVPWAVTSQAVASWVAASQVVAGTWVIVEHSLGLAAASQAVIASQVVVASVAEGSTFADLAVVAVGTAAEDMAADHKLVTELVMSQRRLWHVYQCDACLHVSPFFFCA